MKVSRNVAVAMQQFIMLVEGSIMEGWQSLITLIGRLSDPQVSLFFILIFEVLCHFRKSAVCMPGDLKDGLV